MKKLSVLFLDLCICFILYYLILPPINLSNGIFWFYLICVYLILVISYGAMNFSKITIVDNKIVGVSSYKFIFLLGFILFFGPNIVNFVFSPFFNANTYYSRINVLDGNYDDVDAVNFTELALLDYDSTTKLGDRTMGQLTDLVSQFTVSNMYDQITSNETILRVTPLEYNGLIKYFSNRSEGIAGYISVDSVSGESNLVRLDKGMKYASSAYFGEDLYRALRFSYLFDNFGDISFEIDDDGNPFYIVPVLSYKGIGLLSETVAVIVFNPIDGTSEKYDLSDVPDWVDRVHDTSLIFEQLSDWGKYKNGFLNSIFGQKEVVTTTDGYNYLSYDGDLYLYTGITSVLSDESNIGFVMSNLRTKETYFYGVAGAEEYSAMGSAEGQVQNLGYKSTFPLLINLNGNPTYLVSLKDNAGLVKMYGFVDYTDYQKVVVTDSSLGINKAASNYLGGSIGDTLSEEFKISNITSVVIEGTTHYYISDSNNFYKVSVTVDESILPFLQSGDTIKVTYIDGDLREITTILKN